MKASSFAPEEETEFQIAPMIDVLMVLLVFFITITSTAVLRTDRSLDLPVAPHSRPTAPAPVPVVINVLWDAQRAQARAQWDAEPPRDLAALTGALRVPVSQNPEYRVLLRADRAAPHAAVQAVMAACAEAGVTHFAFAVLPRD